MNEDTLSKFAKMQSLITRREAMIAENQSRLHQGYAPAYNDSAFFEIADEFEKMERSVYD
jgi:predicted DNA-binding protein YlxM (UPF0122 family)